MSALSTLSPRIKHSALALMLTGEMMTNYVRALSVIAANPGATNKCVSEIINRPQGSMGLPCRAARATLSISDSRGASDATVEDYDKYAGVCSVLGVTPCEGTTFRKVHTVEAVPVVNLETVQPDPLAELRRLVREIRGRMKHDGIVSMEITRDEVKVTRSVTTTSALRV
jgi:hypothetical protein